MYEVSISPLNIRNVLPEGLKYETNYKKHELFIDSVKIENIECFLNELNNEYNNAIYNENTKINFKLILNLDDYILLQNRYIPGLFFPL